MFREFRERWLEKLRGNTRRVIVIALTGFESAQVDRLAEIGLLHYLPLLEDIGTRVRLGVGAASDLQSVASALRSAGVKLAMIPPETAHLDSLDAICAADRNRLEQLISILKRQRRGVVLCEFAMLAQLAAGYGLTPTADEQLILRDVHARMDEHVGKVLSFVDERTSLVVAIWPHGAGRTAVDTSQGELLVSKPIATSGSRSCALQELVLQLLESTSE